jgi:signal transduction histidine kinase
LLAIALGGGLAAAVGAALHAATTLSDDGKADKFVAEFMGDVGWMFPVLAIAVLAVAAVTIRRSLKALRAVSAQASAIAPGAVALRLPTEGLPSELEPVVAAVNGALERLAKGFEIQRKFTADAAHELRTPLAILSAGLENLPTSAEVEHLCQDAERMNRLVAQLLRVARLDAQPMDLSQTVDLCEISSRVVEHLAPWAAKRGCRLAFEGAEAPVWIKGNADSLGDAVRNLVENAIAHSPAGEEVIVGVDATGCVLVSDRGPGVPAVDREKVFERFWRSRERRASSGGAGLGLAIVAEIARAHGGHALVTDARGGGAQFVLSLPRGDG